MVGIKGPLFQWKRINRATSDGSPEDCFEPDIEAESEGIVDILKGVCSQSIQTRVDGTRNIIPVERQERGRKKICRT